MYYSNQYMDQAKRQLSIDMSWEDTTKRIRTSDQNQSVSCLEDLSNELLYDIFEYLDGYAIFDIFSNLNQRFANLVIHSNLPLKIRAYNSPTQSFHIITSNKYRISSLHLFDRTHFINFFLLHPLDSSFHRLESIILFQIKSNELLSSLSCLTTLPRLLSLKISVHDTLNDTNEIYRLIFRLPMLRYNKLSANRTFEQVLMSVPFHEQFSSIQRLIINHPYSLDTLCSLLSHTPYLEHLTCLSLSRGNSFNIPLRLVNLRYCSIRKCHLTFDQFEIFIKNICSQLRVLRFSPRLDIGVYLDPDQWERLISQHMPYLHTFQFECTDTIARQNEFQPHHLLLNRFTSIFWIEKGWIFHIQTRLIYCARFTIDYSVQPYKRQWYDLLNDENDKQESVDISKSICQLTVRGCNIEKIDQEFIDYYGSITALVKITSLNIEFLYFSMDILMKFFELFPDLDVLTISFDTSNSLKPMNLIHTNQHMNKITKVNINQMDDISQIDILMNLCPSIECLYIQCKNSTDIKSILRLLATKQPSNIASLYLSISLADDLMIKSLQTTIDMEKLFVNYTIQRIQDRIYIEWKRH